MKTYKYEKSFTFEGKRYRVRGDSEQEVIEKMTLKKRDLKEGKVILNHSTLVSAWAKTCIDTYKPNISDKTRRNIDYLLKGRIFPFIGHMPISSVKPVHCQQILNNMAGMSKNSIVKVSQLLNLIFRTARENQLIITEPTEGIVRPDGAINHRRSITELERNHLLKVCYSDVKYIPFLFMLYCGCRPAEALGVRANDIQEIKGVKALHIRGTKTVNADRYVPIPLDFMKYIEEVSPEGFDLFVQKNGDVLNEAAYRALTKQLKKEINISMGARVYRNQLVPPLPLAKDFTPYCLRHTYCTDLKKAGVPLGIAKDYMGHADVSTTANIYSHSDDDTFLAGAKILGVVSDEGVTVGVTVKGRKMS